MSTVASDYSIAAQKADISANLNFSLVLNFLMGIYTMVYVGTVYLYMSKGGPTLQRRVVLSSITALYILCIVITALEWYSVQWAVVNNGDTRATIFVASVDTPLSIYIALEILHFLLFIVADGLLIWRCFYVWNRSIRVVALPLFLLLTELTLTIAVAVYSIRGPIFTNAEKSVLVQYLQCALLFLSFINTTTTTGLIAWRIYPSTRMGAVQQKGQQLRHIMQVLVESAAIFSLVLLVNAIVAVVPFDIGSGLDVASYFLEVLLPIVGGMAPTIMVTRIALVNNPNNSRFNLSGTTRVSNLNFRAPQDTRDDLESRRDNRRRHLSNSKGEVFVALDDITQSSGTESSSNSRHVLTTKTQEIEILT